MEERFTFQGKNALVLGTGGMGEKIINELFANGIQNVFAGDKSDEHLSSFDIVEGARLYLRKLDLAKDKEKRAFIKWLRSFQLPVHIFVHAAGMVGKPGYFQNWKHKDRRLVQRVNADSLEWFVSELTNSFFDPQKLGRIIAVTSMASFKPGPGALPYDASKGEMNAFMTGFAEECGGKQKKGVDIKSNIIAPRMVATSMTEHIQHTENVRMREMQLGRFKQKSFSRPVFVAYRVIELLKKNAHGEIIDEYGEDLKYLFYEEPYKKLISIA